MEEYDLSNDKLNRLRKIDAVVNCICGSTLKTKYLNEHLKTKRHTNFVKTKKIEYQVNGKDIRKEFYNLNDTVYRSIFPGIDPNVDRKLNMIIEIPGGF